MVLCLYGVSMVFLLKKIAVAFGLAILVLPLFGCASEDSASRVIWDRVLGGVKADDGEAVATTSDGVYLVGNTQSKGAGEDDIWVLKFDTAGRIVWENVRGGKKSDSGATIAEASDGGVLVAGSTKSFNGQQRSGWVLKFDEDGQLLWETFPKKGDCELVDIVATPDGGAIVAGNAGLEYKDRAPKPWVIKINAKGKIVWERMIPNKWDPVVIKMKLGGIQSLVRGLDGSLFVVSNFREASGKAAKKAAKKADRASLMKLSAQGQLLWERKVGSAYRNQARDMTLAADGGIFIVGLMQPNSKDDGNLWALKFDKDGKLLWERAFGSKGYDGGKGIAATADGGVILAGWIQSRADDIATQTSDLWAIKLDAQGNFVKEILVGAPKKIDYAQGVAIASDGKALITGATMTKSAGDYDLWLLKLDME